MAAHTPGPWILDPKEDREGHRQIVRDGYALALVCMRASSPASGPKYFERDANARLIAAAPELLAALKELRRASLAYGSASDVEMDAAFAQLLHARNMAHLAIAKAEGR